MPKFTFAAQQKYGDGTISRLEYPITQEGRTEKEAMMMLPPHHVNPRLIAIDDPSAEKDFLRDPVRWM